MNKSLMVLGILLLVFGGVWSFLPHDVHQAVTGMATGHGNHAEAKHMEEMGHHGDHSGHGVHLTIGAIGMVLGAALVIAGWKIFD